MNGGATEAHGQLITVFGGTGFLGRRIVRHVLDAGFRVRTATRHPGKVTSLFRTQTIEAVHADVLQDNDIAAAVDGAHGVVNAVSLYVENGRATFEAIHVDAAEHIAALSRKAGVRRLVYVSGLGADPLSTEEYISARGRGETAVIAAFGEANIVRPAVMFGPDDAFLTTIVRLVDLLPVYPMFGDGGMKLQPAYVEDVGAAVRRLLEEPRHDGNGLHELAGPTAYTYRELVETVAIETGSSTRPIAVPFGVWKSLAAIAERLPTAPLTRHQIALIEKGNVPFGDKPGLRELGIEPRPIEPVIQAIRRDRETGAGVLPEGDAT